MIDKLKEIITHFQSLENKMADTSLINDQKLYTEMAKEHRRLSPIVEKSNQYLIIADHIEDHLVILDSNDKDLKDIAKSEIEDLEQSLTKLEDELKILQVIILIIKKCDTSQLLYSINTLLSYKNIL